mgnify:CR=1 FL=1
MRKYVIIFILTILITPIVIISNQKPAVVAVDDSEPAQETKEEAKKEEEKPVEVTPMEVKPVEKPVEAPRPTPTPKPAPKPVQTGSKWDWLKAAGIPESDWRVADILVTKESSWNPNAVNRSSGACGLAQALPCSKLGSNWNNPVHALQWMDRYVRSRYGSWQAALNFHYSHNWY